MPINCELAMQKVKNNGSVAFPLRYVAGHNRTPKQTRSNSTCDRFIKTGTGTKEKMRREPSAKSLIDLSTLFRGSPGAIAEIADAEVIGVAFPS